MAKKISLVTLLLLLFSLSYSQNLTATYSIKREITGLPEDISVEPLNLTGLYYKKGNRIISYQKADYLKTYPENRIIIKDYSILIYTDSIQNYYAADLDSLVMRYRYSQMTGENQKNYFRHFEMNFRKWEITNDSAYMSGLPCKKAILYYFGSNKTKYCEIWFYDGIEMPIGVLNLINVPGLIVKAYFYGTHETYDLIDYNTEADIPGAVFWPKEFNEPFKKEPDLKLKR